jgi:hypothetical protein
MELFEERGQEEAEVRHVQLEIKPALWPLAKSNEAWILPMLALEKRSAERYLRAIKS